MTLRCFLGGGKDVFCFNKSRQNMVSAIVAVQAEGVGRKCCQLGAGACERAGHAQNKRNDLSKIIFIDFAVTLAYLGT
jgi:hypothetical protein